MPELITESPPHEPANSSQKVPAPFKMYMDLLQSFGEELKNPQSSLLYKVAVWHVAIKMLKWIENNAAQDRDDQEIHRDLLDIIIFLGVGLSREVKENKTILSSEFHGTTELELNATLDWLRDKRNMYHGDVTPARKAAILNSLFGDAAAA